MASIVLGYEYDIFISYRQNDNKYDGWVTEFVTNLKMELEATLKYELSVYFDINPHDGLLDTHDVSASLRDKLKCLIFIPIISQTYCDSKSFAWQYEFCAFNKLAKEDKLGREIRLAGGNVASRILPVKIHDLDNEDKILLENELGGVLRSIEFIYKSAGVNRPLRANEDRPQENLSKTYYRDQINKVANAVKELITAIKRYEQQDGEKPVEVVKLKTGQTKNRKTKILAGSLLTLTLIIIAYILVSKLFISSGSIEKSIAVLPFVNDSPDHENGYFINGIMDEVLNNLQQIKDFRVLSRTSTEQFRDASGLTIPEIGKKLDVNYIVEGSGQKYGSTFRLRVQLIEANNEKHLWGESFEQEIRETNDIFKIQNRIAQSIAAELKATITPEEKQRIDRAPTASLTAYDFYQRGQDEIAKCPYPDYTPAVINSAERYFQKALDYDSTFALAYYGIAEVLWIKLDRDPAVSDRVIFNKYLDSMLVFADIALSFDDKLEGPYIIRAAYYSIKGTIKQTLAEYDNAIRYNPNSSWAYFMKGLLYEELDIVKSLENLEKAASLDHGNALTHSLTRIGLTYCMAGFPEKGIDFFHEALKLDGDSIKYSINTIRLTKGLQGDYNKVVDHLEKIYLKDSTNPEVLDGLGLFYSILGKYKESLKYYEKYLSEIKERGQGNQYISPFIGYVYMQNGYRKEAEDFFNIQTERYIKGFESSPVEKYIWAYQLAVVYASRGNKAKVFEYLKIFNQNQSFTLKWVNAIRHPVFNSISNEPEYQKIVRNVDTKYQVLHKNVEVWLKDQGKL